GGESGFGFFAFTPFGVPMLAIAILYMLVARRWLGRRAPGAAPTRASLAGWIDEYQLATREFRLRVRADSPLVGHRLQDLDLRASSGINLLIIERRERFGQRLIEPSASSRLEAGDVLLLDAFGPEVDIDKVARRFGLEQLVLQGAYFSDHAHDIGMAEIMLPAHSPLIGRTLVQARFRSLFNLAVIGLKRGQVPHRDGLRGSPLRAGDSLLVEGSCCAILQPRSDTSQLVIIQLPVEFDEAPPAAARAPYALAALAVVIVLMATGAVPNVQAALIGCLLLGLFG